MAKARVSDAFRLYLFIFASMMENKQVKGMEYLKFLEMLFAHQAKNI